MGLLGTNITRHGTVRHQHYQSQSTSDMGLLGTNITSHKILMIWYHYQSQGTSDMELMYQYYH